jgi:3-methylfumaryl-CoA hydratase
MENADLGISKKSKEICSLSMVRRVAAMLDLDVNTFAEGDLLPKGWHFFMLAGETKKSDLRADGFPGLGVPIPELTGSASRLPRLLLGGRTVIYQGGILIGSVVEKTSFVKNITEKTTASGRMAIVTIQHELQPITDEKPAIIETQTYILKELGNNQL